MANLVAGPVVRLIEFDVALVRPPPLKSRVYVPTSPLIASPPNVATPLALVVAVALVSDGVPPGLVAIVAVISVPFWLTALPLASWIWITGCVAKATPLWALLEGCVVIPSLVATPADRAIAVDVSGVR